MTRPDHHRTPRETARDAAAAWHVRLASEEAVEADWLAFEAWLAEAPENVVAYDRVEALWDELGEVALSASALPDIAATAAADAPAGPRRSQPTRLRGSGRETRRRPVPAAWGSAIAASLAAAIGLGWMLHDPAPTTVYATAKGEQRVVALADGTQLRLNSGSRLSVRLGRRSRTVELTEGEAAFDVAHDASRPFVVTAGDRAVRDVGTAFDVLRHSGRIEVVVQRGIVEVAPGVGEAGVRLLPGQAIRRREGAPGPDTVRAADPEAAFAWTQGRLVYRDRPLAEVAADLNRYLPTPVAVAPAARDLRLTAVLTLDSQEAMLAKLAAFLPVTPVRQAGSVTLELRQARR
jgi:transmembrane sensor